MIDNITEKLKFLDATDAFEHLYECIMKYGKETSISTKAIYNVGFEIANPCQRIIRTEWRKFNVGYAEKEWSWYLSQDRSVKDIKKHA